MKITGTIEERPPIIQEARVFFDVLQPGAEIEISLCAYPESSFLQKITALAEEYIETYIAGKNGGLPAPIPAMNGRAVEITEQTCRVIAALQIMEQAHENSSIEGQQTEFLHYVILSIKAPNAFEEIDAFAGEVLAKSRGLLKNE